MRSNPMAQAIANYTRVVNDCFGGVSDPRASVSTMVNDCIVCDTAAKARAEGRKSWSVSTTGQPLCADCNAFRLQEMMG
jgi:hypothetical protein